MTDAVLNSPGGTLLQVSHLSKAYGTTQALTDVTMGIEAGEIHGLLGANGSGKSTLIKILAGVVEPDRGELRLRGEDVRLPLTAADSERHGLRFVHQNLGLVGTLSVCENLSMASFAVGNHRVKWRALFAQAKATLERYELRVDPRATVDALSPLQRAQVAIARALSSLSTEEHRNALLVLDEPTVYLPMKEVGTLFELLHRVVGHGHAALLVTHRLSELLENSQRVSVLRDSKIVATKLTAETTETELVEMAVGSGWQTVSGASIRIEEKGTWDSGGDSVQVRGLRTRKLRDVNLQLSVGEIHGLTGLADSGYEEILYSLFGANDRASGNLSLRGQDLDLSKLDPASAIKAKISLVPVDRLVQGVAGSSTIEESLSLPVLGRYFQTGFLRLRLASAASRELISSYGIVASGNRAQIDTLSGGNQQKVLVAKWLQRQPDLLLLSEPTQGVDVRARHDIWQYVRRAAGAAPVLIASSDYDELANLCTAVSIVAAGKIAKTLTGENLSADVIAAECLQGPDPDAAVSERGSAG